MMRSSNTTPRFVGALLATAVTLSGACTYQRAYIAYDRYKGGLPLAATPLNGEAVGVVAAAESGPVWKDCTKVAEAAVWVLIDETRRVGGNAVGNIRWFPDETVATADRPCCRQRWGWVLVWPVLATPAFQIAKVQGTAYRLAAPEPAPNGLYVIPETEDARADLVARIVNDARVGDP
jgi:hypothetical protein